MTYPPQPGQPGQPGQPDPNQPGGYPQSGGFGQQGQPYGGQQYPPTSGYEQQQYPQGGYQQPQYPPQGGYQQQPGYGQPQYPPPGQGFGGPPAPPPKSKTGMLVGIAVAVVVIVALGITGFVAPGFFLSKSSDKAASAPADSSAPVAPPAAPSGLPSAGSLPTGDIGDVDPAAKSVAEKFLAAINSKDVDGAFAMMCQVAANQKDDLAKYAASGTTFKAQTYVTAAGSVSAVLVDSAGNPTGALALQKATSGNDYCVSAMLKLGG
jgi:hypothetical protein